MTCEVHGTGAGNLTSAPPSEQTWYERGLLHPFIDYDKPPATCSASTTRWTPTASSTCRNEPGLGQDIDFDYIEANLVKT